MSSQNTTRRNYLRNVGTVAGALSLGVLGSTGLGSAQAVTIGETGTVSARQRSESGWKSVSFDAPNLTNPIVIMKPVSHNGHHPSHIRLRNVTNDGFEYKIEEWDYLDGRHTKETFHYLALSEGIYDLAGTAISVEAGRVSTDTSSSTHVDLGSTFDEEPAVLTQPQTFNGHEAIVSRTEISSTDAFGVSIQEQEAGGPGSPNYHKVETVGYVAVERGTGILDPVLTPFEAGRRSSVNSDWTQIQFQQEYDSDPLFMADMNTMNGPNTAGLRYQNLDKDSERSTS